MLKFKVLTVIILTLFSIDLISKIKPSRSIGRDVQEVARLKRELNQHEKSLKKIEILINNVNRDLNVKSKYYFKVINSRQKIEAVVVAKKKKLKENEVLLKKFHNETQRFLKITLLKIFDKNSSPSDLLSAKILIKHLKDKIVKLQTAIIDNQLILKRLRTVEVQYKKQVDVEIELAQFLHDLEIKKSDLEIKKENKVLLKKRLSKQVVLSEIKRRRKRKKVFSKVRIKTRFLSPVESFYKEEHRKKGISYSYSVKQPVFAPAKGEVVVSRGLSTFGKVVMIDHGGGVRSVMLGTFSPTVMHGSRVEKGGIIGYTEIKKKFGKLYFEVRRDSKAYNTYKLMDKNFYKKLKKFNTI